MTRSAPVVYLLHGEDDFAIAQFVHDLEAKLGDATIVAMNLTRLDGRSYAPDRLLAATNVMPFLAKRRIVVLTYPMARLTTPTLRKKFLEDLEKIPPTTALVLIEPKLLTDERDRRRARIHWLEEWAGEHAEWVLLRAFPLLSGPQLTNWIMKYARELGGQFTNAGANLLAAYVGENSRLADQEVRKLLDYVAYRRPVDVDDVEALTPNEAQVSIFAMVDELGNRNGRQAAGLLHRLMEQDEPLSIFQMIIRQFRLLLQTRECLDRRQDETEIARALKIHPYVAGKIAGQARRFDLATLESIYRRLLGVDEAIKTGKIEAGLALDTLVAALTN